MTASLQQLSKIKLKLKPAFHRLNGYLKIIWLLIVCWAALHFIYYNSADLTQSIQTLKMSQILAFVVSLFLAKLFISMAAEQSLKWVSSSLGLQKMYYIYTLTDIAKYLPGGIWAIFSRISVYKLEGICQKKIAKAFILENLWLISSSLALGIILTDSHTFQTYLPQFTTNEYIVGKVLIFIAWIISILFINNIYGVKNHLRNISNLVFIQIVITVFLGLGISVLLPIAQWSLYFTLNVIGAFAVARVAGYFAFFAPAGIGVRELVFVLMLQGQMEKESLYLLAGHARILTVISELLLFFVVWTIFRKKFEFKKK